MIKMELITFPESIYNGSIPPMIVNNIIEHACQNDPELKNADLEFMKLVTSWGINNNTKIQLIELTKVLIQIDKFLN